MMDLVSGFTISPVFVLFLFSIDIIIKLHHIIIHIIYFHSMDPYRITKSIWIWKWSYLLKKSRSRVNIKVYNNFSYWVYYNI